jgi:hypothetical protein
MASMYAGGLASKNARLGEGWRTKEFALEKAKTKSAFSTIKKRW